MITSFRPGLRASFTFTKMSGAKHCTPPETELLLLDNNEGKLVMLWRLLDKILPTHAWVMSDDETSRHCSVCGAACVEEEEVVPMGGGVWVVRERGNRSAHTEWQSGRLAAFFRLSRGFKRSA